MMKKLALSVGLTFGLLSGAAFGMEGLGRVATPDEVKAWDIDVRPDFKGLPVGKGSVELGMEVWEGKCASCHGVFGESNEVFTPIVGGTTAEDVKTGHVKSLVTGSVPQRTTMMKVATISSIWDYIHRAMPWTNPKSLTPDEVYGVVAYILNLSEIVPEDFVLSNENIADMQAKMPNRNGMTEKHGMWLVGDKPDVQEKRCMKNCKAEAKITSFLPEYAQDAHGNLADQNRLVGPVRGMVTVAEADMKKELPKLAAGEEIFNANGCTACHAVNEKRLGPSLKDVAKKYAGDDKAVDYLAKKIAEGGAGVWGDMPMPPHPQLSDADLKSVAQWVLGNK